MQKRLQVWLGAILLSAACGGGGGQPAGPRGPAVNDSDSPGQVGNDGAPPGPGGGDEPVPPAPPHGSTPYATSRGSAILWKRHAAFEADLMSALELGRDVLCKELGERNCIRDIHVIALGGNDPFRSGINLPPKQPLSTTSIVVDRVLLSACSARARADKQKPARVFTELDLEGPAPAREAPAVDATITALFRRLLARDPKPNESAIIKTLLDPAEPDGPQSAEEFATLACFAIGSSLEFLFH